MQPLAVRMSGAEGHADIKNAKKEESPTAESDPKAGISASQFFGAS